MANDWPWLTLVPILLLAALLRLALPACFLPSAPSEGSGCKSARRRFSRLIRGFATFWMGRPSPELHRAFRAMAGAKPPTTRRGWTPPRADCLDLSTSYIVNWPMGLFFVAADSDLGIFSGSNGAWELVKRRD